MNYLTYLAVLGIPVGICTLVYLAMAILKKQRDNRFYEACERLSEETEEVECQVDLEDKDFDYVKDVLEKAVKIVREEAEDEAFYKQVQASITGSRPATLFERDLAEACKDSEYNSEFQKELTNIKNIDFCEERDREIELTDNELDEFLVSVKTAKPKKRSKKKSKKKSRR